MKRSCDHEKPGIIRLFCELDEGHEGDHSFYGESWPQEPDINLLHDRLRKLEKVAKAAWKIMREVENLTPYAPSCSPDPCALCDLAAALSELDLDKDLE